MLYNPKKYSVFGLCPLFGTLKNREHNVSETGSVSVLRLALSKRPNRVGASLSSEDGNRSYSKTFFCIFRILDDEQYGRTNVHFANYYKNHEKPFK
jgi:hypothetical protein